MRRPVAILFWVISAFALMGSGFMVWLLKDGLGPDAVDSHGVVAFTRFCSGIALLTAIFVLPPFLLGCILYPWRRRTE